MIEPAALAMRGEPVRRAAAAQAKCGRGELLDALGVGELRERLQIGGLDVEALDDEVSRHGR